MKSEAIMYNIQNKKMPKIKKKAKNIIKTRPAVDIKLSMN